MKTSLLILAMFISIKGVAQQDSVQKTLHSEIKINAFNLIIFKAVDLSYEYFLNENQSIGVALLFKINPELKEVNPYQLEISQSRNFSITSFHRHFFSKKYAKGFFVEGFAMYAAGKEVNRTQGSKDTLSETFITKYKSFSLGMNLGLKLVSKKNLTIDINFGVGVEPFKIDDKNAGTRGASRGGISVGYRF